MNFFYVIMSVKGFMIRTADIEGNQYIETKRKVR